MSVHAKSPPSERISIGRLLLIAPLFLGGIILVKGYAIQRGMPLYPIWLVALVFIGIGPLKLLLHELGHVAAGRLAGFRIQRFSWGPFCWSRLADGWHFRWLPELGYLRGWVWIAPESSDSLRFRQMLFVAGGALTEFLSGCVALMLFLATPALGLSQFGLALGFWAVVTLCAPLFALATDGPAFRTLFAGGKASDDYCGRFLPLISWATEIRPADWPEEWFPSSLDSYYKHLDRGELETAIEQLTLAIQVEFQSLSNPLVCLEAAYLSARVENSSGKARAWLAGMKTGYPVERFVELRAEAAVLYAEGDRLKSAACAEEALRLIEPCPATGWTLMNASLLRGLHERAAAATEDFASAPSVR
jgi:hypothetical protein